MPVQCNFISGVAPVDTDHPILFIEAFSPALLPRFLTLDFHGTTSEVLSTLAHVLFSEATLKLLPFF
ncbi:hypothetical protein DSO57_1039170 [Entomophthora muscae]|uniref:Uncharacterized protein n=1 Tax=Entomophthora muscae TaxID=34485 RepID=A0ACC2TAC6_9FUNG|nr:hypothetical protein DSO57_1039170 [Entomophthora muscae]